MRPGVALLVGVLAVLAAVGGGLALGRLARPSPTPVRVIVTATPTATPARTPLDETALFKQPLAAGCATAEAVWIVTNGGGLLRYDGAWAQVDDTLRSLTAVACLEHVAVAVGLVGSFVVMDDVKREIRANELTINDLFGVSVVGDGALMVGSFGSVYILAGGDVQPYATGIEDDLRDVVAFTQRSAWAVGAGGVAYRLDQRGWGALPSGQANTLRAVAGRSAATVIAVGDAGTVATWDGAWRTVASGVATTLRDVIVDPVVWIAGDAGTLLRGGTGGPFERIDLRTACDLLSLFTRQGAVWVVGSGPGGGGVWRLDADGTVAQRWGGC